MKFVIRICAHFVVLAQGLTVVVIRIALIYPMDIRNYGLRHADVYKIINLPL